MLTLPVRDNIVVTPRARILRLDLQHHRFCFQAGQAVLAGAHGQPMRRPYSIAIAPEDAARDGVLELLVQVEEDGHVPEHLPSGTGTLMDAEGPVGAFTFPDRVSEQHLLFVAGGTGIAPLRSMLRHVLRTAPNHDIALLYSARRPDEFAYEAELRGLAARGRLRLHQTITRETGAEWNATRGRIDRALLSGMLRDEQTLCFVCGPQTLVQEIPTALMALGVAPERIRTDAWVA